MISGPSRSLGVRDGTSPFAEAQGHREPHEVIHTHLQSVYGTGGVIPPLGPWLGEVSLFTMEELRAALAMGKKGKAVGVDGTSLELLQGVASLPGGAEALLRFYNTVYREAAIPAEWNSALMLVIPKELHPTDPKNLRPLSLGSSVAKVFCRLLMFRTSGALAHTGPSQCSGSGRQTNEYVFSVSRIMQLETEWHAGFAIAKIDLHKAYDLVDRGALLRRLKHAMGDGPTFRCWHALLSDTTAVLQTGWGLSYLQLDRGIKQGSIESPAMFSWLAEQILEDVKARCMWDSRPKVYRGLAIEEVLFMDDGCVWAPGAEELACKLQEWAVELRKAGLLLNPAKCKVYFSPYMTGPREVRVEGVLIPEVDVFEVMGVPFRVGASTSELLAPFLQRAKDKFWSLKHLLRARTPLAGRLRLLDRVVGGMVLWCLASISPDQSGMTLLNGLQLQLVVWAMRVGKRGTETWLQFKQRAFRGAKQMVWKCLKRRWSTCWLERWWGFAGHRARGLDREVPCAASVIDDFRNREWWTWNQGRPVQERVQHPRHFPRLSNLRIWTEQQEGFGGLQPGIGVDGSTARSPGFPQPPIGVRWQTETCRSLGCPPQPHEPQPCPPP